MPLTERMPTIIDRLNQCRHCDGGLHLRPMHLRDDAYTATPVYFCKKRDIPVPRECNEGGKSSQK